MFFNIRENLLQLKHLRIYTGTSLEDKKSSTWLDAKMGIYDGGELCKLIWIFTQAVLQDIVNKEALGVKRVEELTVPTKVNTEAKKRIKV